MYTPIDVADQVLYIAIQTIEPHKTTPIQKYFLFKMGQFVMPYIFASHNWNVVSSAI